MTRVSLVRSQDRRDAVRRALELVGEDAARRLSRRRPVVKPNLVSTTNQLASSHVDQVRGILDFLASVCDGPVLVAEASCHDTGEAFRNFGYEALLRERNVELVDLNDGPFEDLTVLGGEEEPFTVRAATLLLDPSNCVISAARMKTHDTVVVSLSVKNAAMGGIARGEKQRVHQGIIATNLAIAELAERLWPDIAVIDGHEGMEGSGPTSGDPVPLGIAIAGTDALAADRIACEIMGVNLHEVGYLHYCAVRGRGTADLAEIEVLGEELRDCVRPFRLHNGVGEQYLWK